MQVIDDGIELHLAEDTVQIGIHPFACTNVLVMNTEEVRDHLMYNLAIRAFDVELVAKLDTETQTQNLIEVPKQRRRKRVPVPEHLKTAAYHRRRKRNTESARRWRERKR